MRQVPIEKVLASLEAAVADPTNEKKKAKLNRLSGNSFAYTVEILTKEVKRQMQERR